jgi:acyl-ACP thioesterase
VHLGDVGHQGRLRLEALARFLQDVAGDDVDEAGIAGAGAWVVRRSVVRIQQLPTYHESVDLLTWCSGTGACWAERRTTMAGARGEYVEAATLWVLLDSARGRPIPLGDEFFRVFGEATDGRRVSTRLSHRRPPPVATARVWPLRESDFDVLDHVNNARYWEAIEDELVFRVPRARVVSAEVEFRGAVERGDELELVSTAREREGATELSVWLLAGGEVRMSGVVATVAP